LQHRVRCLPFNSAENNPLYIIHNKANNLPSKNSRELDGIVVAQNQPSYMK
jgi:hypothetical protein